MGKPREERWGIILKNGTLIPGFSSFTEADEHRVSMGWTEAVVRQLGQNEKATARDAEDNELLLNEEMYEGMVRPRCYSRDVIGIPPMERKS